MHLDIVKGLQRGSAVIGALNGLIPLIGALVQGAEAAFPNPGSGAQKLEHVISTVKTYLGFIGNAVADIEAIVPTLVLAINNVVDAAKGRITVQGQPTTATPSNALTGTMPQAGVTTPDGA